MSKTIDIFCKSFRNDFWLLHLSLATIKKNVTGYNNLILLIPEKDKQLFDTRELPERTLVFYVDDPNDENGWLLQQIFKMNAHKYSSADFIMFSDSDCLFDHKINLQDFIADGKPEILYTDWDKVGDAIIWKEPTEKFMKEPVPFEMMRRNTLVYHRSTLEAIEKYAPNLVNDIMKELRWSEFNAMSAFAFKYERDKYNFISTDNWTYTEPKAIQVWSHASKAAGASENHLREYIRTLEAIIKAFQIPIPA